MTTIVAVPRWRRRVLLGLTVLFALILAFGLVGGEWILAVAGFFGVAYCTAKLVPHRIRA